MDVLGRCVDVGGYCCKEAPSLGERLDACNFGGAFGLFGEGERGDHLMLTRDVGMARKISDAGMGVVGGLGTALGGRWACSGRFGCYFGVWR